MYYFIDFQAVVGESEMGANVRGSLYPSLHSVSDSLPRFLSQQAPEIANPTAPRLALLPKLLTELCPVWLGWLELPPDDR